MEWFRMYSEFASDPKVQSISEAMQRRLTMLFCLRGAETLHTLTEDEIAFALRITDDDLAETKALFVRKGFITEAWEIQNWDKRQFVSDSSKNRVSKYREKRKAMGLSSNGYTKHSETVMVRDGHACVYCGAKEKLCIDHAYPVDLGGNDDIDNLVCACKACNSGKAGRTPAQAGYTFRNKVTEASWLDWVSKNHVTVTVTPQIQNRTDTEQSREAPDGAVTTAGAEDDQDDERADESTKAKGVPACPVGEIVNAFHDLMPLNPKVRVLDDARKRTIRARWREASLLTIKPFGYETAADGLTAWKRFFEVCADSPFLTGRTKAQDGRAPFVADIDFLMSPSGFKKCLENKYHRDAS